MYGTSNTVITLLGQMSMLASSMGLVDYVDIATTINSIRGINSGAQREDGDVRTMQYFGIGIRGSSYGTVDLGGDTVNSLTPYRPSEKNMDLFKPIPVLVVPAGTTVDVGTYRMRETKTFGTDPTEFDVYWLKKCTVKLTGGQEMYIQTVEGESDTRTDYDIVATSEFTHPEPTEDLISVANLVVGTVLECDLTGAELANTITYYLEGRSELAIISEFGIYMGSELSNEAIEVQLAIHRCIRGHDLSTPQQRVTEQFAIEKGGSIIAKAW